MYKKILLISFITTYILSSCNNNDDNNTVTYLDPKEQITYDQKAIEYLLDHYYISEQGDLTKFESCDSNGDGVCDDDDDCDTNGDGICDTTDNCDINGDGICDDDDIIIPAGAQALKNIVSPLSNGGYYAILNEKQGSGVMPSDSDSLVINYGIQLFNSTVNNNVKTGYYPSFISRSGNLYSGTEGITDPTFFYYSLEKYARSYATNIGKLYRNLTTSDWETLTNQYNDNNIYARYVIPDYVEAIKKIQSRNLDVNAPISIQAVIIEPSANSKSLEAYNSIGGLKSYFSVALIDLLKVETR